MKEKLLVIGNGMAGMRCVEEILQRTPEKFDITVFGAEPHGNYNRILLSPVLAGEKTIDDIMINTREWYDENNITLFAGKEHYVVNIDSTAQTITTLAGETHSYDKLIVSTGSNPITVSAPGIELDGIMTFRDIEDIHTLEADAKKYKNAVVIGGGLLGLEAAYGLEKKGMDVTVVHRSNILLNRQLDQTAATLLEESLKEKKLKFKLSANTVKFHGDEAGRVKAIELDDGSTIEAQLIVIAIGVKPNAKLAEASNLDVNRGIIVNDKLETSAPNVYAVGECVEFNGETFGLVAPLFDQATVLADVITSTSTDSAYNTRPLSTQLKVSGINLFSAGHFNGTESSKNIVYKDIKHGVYKKLVVENNKLVGAVIYGDTKDSLWYFDFINDQTDIGNIRDTLIFGQAYSQA